MRGLLVLALASCSSDSNSYQAPPTVPANEIGKPMTPGDSLFRQDFRTAYGSVLWTMMVLRWCDERWAGPAETAKAQARLEAIDAQAAAMGLDEEMRQAADDNARQMAIMRLDTRCHGGFEPALQNAKRALGKVESLIAARK